MNNASDGVDPAGYDATRVGAGDAPGITPAHDTDDVRALEEPSFKDAFRVGLAQAAQSAGIARVAPGEVPTGAALLSAVGGVRGLIESILPGLGFLIAYTLTGDLVISVVIPLAIAVLFVLVRLVTRSSPMPAVAGLAGIAISAVLALMTGKAEDNFVPGLIINLISATVLLVSLIARWPLIGFVVGILTNELTEWHQDRRKRRVLTVVTWLWFSLFTARLLVEYPLYLAQEVEILAAVKLIMGVPLYGAMLWVSWLLVRAVYRGPAETAAPPRSEDSDASSGDSFR